jgi:hypothetical protein
MESLDSRVTPSSPDWASPNLGRFIRAATRSGTRVFTSFTRTFVVVLTVCPLALVEKVTRSWMPLEVTCTYNACVRDNIVR